MGSMEERDIMKTFEVFVFEETSDRTFSKWEWHYKFGLIETGLIKDDTHNGFHQYNSLRMGFQKNKSMT